MLQLRCGTVDILFTGDAIVASEDDMLAAGVLVDLDILKVGHHGSKTSTSDAFLSVVAPEFAVISAGLNSQYGHPDQEVGDRLTAVGATIWETDISGSDDTVGLVSDCQSFNFERPTLPNQ